MHDVEWYCAMNYVRSRDAQKQLARTTLNSDVARFTIHIKPVLEQIRLLTDLNVGGKTRNITIHSFCSNVATQVARFLYL